MPTACKSTVDIIDTEKKCTLFMCFIRSCHGVHISVVYTVYGHTKVFEGTAQKHTSSCLGFCHRPTPEISWEKVGGELPSSRLSFYNFRKTLKVSDVNEGDGGDYRCTATNNLGTASHIIKVTVKGTSFDSFNHVLKRNITVMSRHQNWI